MSGTEVCIPVETVAGRAKLRSARHGDLIVPPTKTKLFGSRSFRCAAPTVWNSLLHHLRQSDISRGQFASGLKNMVVYLRIYVGSATENFNCSGDLQNY